MRTNQTGRKFSLGCRLALLLACFAANVFAGGPRLDAIEFSSRMLKSNPLHDPAVRSVAVFVPAQCTNGARLPVVYYLPGYGNYSGNFIRNSNAWLKLTQELADEITPMLLVVVDGRTRWGGGQYLNSAGQGNYADYVCKEIVCQVENRYPAATQGVRRIIAGHSSGGFGALRLGMANQKLFDGVIALSPDSDFEVSHLPLVKLPGVTNCSLAQVNLIADGKMPVPKNGDLTYALGLSAAYAPRGRFHPGQFDWLYDATGGFRAEVWQRWLDNDPLTLVRKNPRAFRAGQSIYLDGAAHDEYSANVGARKIYEVLRDRPARCAFYEPPGKHSDHVQERLERGLAWVFGRPSPDIE
jgi:S-formylglutathione hydrolase FrmB